MNRIEHDRSGVARVVRWGFVPMVCGWAGVSTTVLLGVGVDPGWIVVPVALSTLVMAMVAERVSPRGGRSAEPHELATDVSYLLLIVFVSNPVVSAMRASLATWLASFMPEGPLSQVPTWLGVVIALLVRDCADYFRHRWLHEYRWLWPIHRAHHLPRRMTALNTLRGHPLSLVVGIAPALIPVLLGATPRMLGIAGVFGAVVAVFSHLDADVRFGWLRYLIVTSHFHRFHHAAAPQEGGLVNYALMFPVFDRMFGTYRSTREADDPKRLGVFGDDDDRHRFGHQLVMPFVDPFRFVVTTLERTDAFTRMRPALRSERSTEERSVGSVDRSRTRADARGSGKRDAQPPISVQSAATDGVQPGCETMSTVAS